MKLPESHVLLVEDGLRMAEVVAALLQDYNIRLTCAPEAAAAFKAIKETHFDLILLDVGLPGTNGFDLLQQFKASPETQAIPVIVLTAWNSTNDKLRGFEMGAVDYLTKPVESGELELANQPLDLRQCVEEALDLLAAGAAEKRIEIAYQMDDGIPPRVVGDVTRLRQVLVNLLSNGIKFTAAGEVVVQVKILSAPLSNSESADTWHLQFSVQDTGIGIPVDRLARLFKSFSQPDASTARRSGG